VFLGSIFISDVLALYNETWDLDVFNPLRNTSNMKNWYSRSETGFDRIANPMNTSAPAESPPFLEQCSQKARDAVNPPRGKSPARNRFSRNGSSKEVRELRDELASLAKRSETAELKVSDFREKMKALRSALAARDKQLAMARRSIEQLGAERDELQAALASTRAHSRKAELQLSQQKGYAEVMSQWKAMKCKVREMEDAVQAAENRAAAAEAAHSSRKSEISTLRAALDVRARELSCDGGHDVSSRLLYAVAKSREEGVALSLQLKEQRELADSLRAELSKSRDHAKRLEGDSRVRQGEREGAEAEAQAALAEARQARADADAAAARTDAISGRYARLEEEAEELRRELRRSREHAAEVEDEMQAARLDTRRQRDEARQSLVDALEDVTNQAWRVEKELREEIESLKAEHGREKEGWQSERAELQRRAGKAEAEVEAQQAKAASLESGTASSQQELRDEITNLHADVETLTETNQRLQSSCDFAQHRLEAEEQRVQVLRERVAELESELEASKAHARREESGNLDGLRQELRDVVRERDRLSGELEKALSSTQGAMAEKVSLEMEVERLMDLNIDLSTSKVQLQKSMLQKAAEFQARIRELERQNNMFRKWHIEPSSLPDPPREGAKVPRGRPDTPASTATAPEAPDCPSGEHSSVKQAQILDLPPDSHVTSCPNSEPQSSGSSPQPAAAREPTQSEYCASATEAYSNAVSFGGNAPLDENHERLTSSFKGHNRAKDGISRHVCGNGLQSPPDSFQSSPAKEQPRSPTLSELAHMDPIAL